MLFFIMSIVLNFNFAAKSACSSSLKDMKNIVSDYITSINNQSDLVDYTSNRARIENILMMPVNVRDIIKDTEFREISIDASSQQSTKLDLKISFNKRNDVDRDKYGNEIITCDISRGKKNIVFESYHLIFNTKNGNNMFNGKIKDLKYLGTGSAGIVLLVEYISGKTEVLKVYHTDTGKHYEGLRDFMEESVLHNLFASQTQALSVSKYEILRDRKISLIHSDGKQNETLVFGLSILGKGDVFKKIFKNLSLKQKQTVHDELVLSFSKRLDEDAFFDKKLKREKQDKTIITTITANIKRSSKLFGNFFNIGANNKDLVGKIIENYNPNINLFSSFFSIPEKDNVEISLKIKINGDENGALPRNHMVQISLLFKDKTGYITEKTFGIVGQNLFISNDKNNKDKPYLWIIDPN